MSQIIEVIVPDIGNFKDVPVIELCVNVGDTVKTEDALLTLESATATIDIPSPVDGVIKEFKVKVGDKVSEGSLVVVLEAESTVEAAKPAPAPTTDAVAAPAPTTDAVAAPAPTPEPVPLAGQFAGKRSEEHTSELQSRQYL